MNCFWKSIKKCLSNKEENSKDKQEPPKIIDNISIIEKHESQNKLDITTLQIPPSLEYTIGKLISKSEDNKKFIKQALSQKGRGLIVKEIIINSNDQDMPNICEGLIGLINIASDFEHKNLVRYLQASFDGEKLEILTEKMPLQFEEIVFSQEIHVKIYLKQILKAMKYLYSKKIYNINLKTNNILFDRTGVLKIRDYIGKTFFNLLTNESSDESSMEDKGDDIYKDIISLINLIRNLIYGKSIKIENIKVYHDFINNLQEFSKNKHIDFDFILNHDFLKYSQSDKNNFETKKKNQFGEFKSHTVKHKKKIPNKYNSINPTKQKKEEKKINNNTSFIEKMKDDQFKKKNSKNPELEIIDGDDVNIEEEIIKLENNANKLLDNLFDVSSDESGNSDNSLKKSESIKNNSILVSNSSRNHFSKINPSKIFSKILLNQETIPELIEEEQETQTPSQKTPIKIIKKDFSKKNNSNEFENTNNYEFIEKDLEIEKVERVRRNEDIEIKETSNINILTSISPYFKNEESSQLIHTRVKLENNKTIDNINLINVKPELINNFFEKKKLENKKNQKKNVFNFSTK